MSIKLKLFGVASVIAAFTIGFPPVASANARHCSVFNKGLHTRYAGLRAAVDAASPLATLSVRGTCTGTTTIPKSLSLVGEHLGGFTSPTLDGGKRGSVLTIARGARVTISSLAITEGAANLGGGINNHGVVIMHASRISGNIANLRGGAIYNAGRGAGVTLTDGTAVTGNHSNFAGGGIAARNGSLTVKDTSRIDGNTATRYGGGVAVREGSVTLQDSSSIRSNRTRFQGGGLYDFDGTVTLTGRSRVGTNGGDDGGGVYINAGTVILDGASVVDGNRARHTGGGICKAGGTLIGAIAGTNVYNNTPNNIAR